MTNLKFYIGQSNGRHFEANVDNIIIDLKNENAILVNRGYEVDEQGNKVVTGVNAEYGRNLIANNSTLVHPTTGAYWNDIPEDERPEGLEPIGEWDFFWNMFKEILTPMVNTTLSKNRSRIAPDGFEITSTEQPVINPETPTE